MVESRKTPRRPVIQGAWIFPGGGSSLIPCMMVDLSDAGARLKLEAETKLPPEFILVLSRDGRLNRRCRIVWRQDDMIGVRFVGRKSISPKAKQAKPHHDQIPAPDDVWDDDEATAKAVADAPALVPETRE